MADAHFDRWEKQAFAVLRRYFQRQEAAVLARLQGKQARKGTRHWSPPGVKALDLDRLLDLRTWDRGLQRDWVPVMTDLYNEVGSDLFSLFSPGDPWNVHDPEVTRAISRRANRITQINETTRDAIRKELSVGEGLGEGIADLSARVSHVFDVASSSRAQMIARTEVVGSSNEASHIAAVASGEVTEKTWLATEDPRTREAHSDADGQTVGLDETFTVDGEDMAYPGDETGSAGNVINCRCTLVYNLSGGGEIEVDTGLGD